MAYQNQNQNQNADLATAYRELYRAKFQNDVLTGTKTPLIVPLHLLGIWILPTLYLAIPHRNRPWLYNARWLVLAFIVVFNFNIILHASSHNFGSAYGAGLVGAWGIVWSFTLLVWTRPQWEAKRVNIRRKRRLDGVKNDYHEQLSGPNAGPQKSRSDTKGGSQEKSASAKTTGLELNGNTANGHESSQDFKGRQTDGETIRLPKETKYISEELLNKLLEAVPPQRQQKNGNNAQLEINLDKLAAEQEFEYYWQEYPADASFWTRLDWAFDIVSTFRMTGWNWAIPSLPPYAPPSKLGPYQLPLSSVGPQRTKQGYTRTLSRKELFLKRMFLNVIPNYLLVDLCAVLMTADPYFLAGPEHTSPLPASLASLPPVLLAARRTALSFAGVASALQYLFSAGALALAFVPPLPQVLGFRAHPWHLPSVNGSFLHVLDRGLPGFWGAWWHQTFRFGFAAPARYLARRGYVGEHTAAARAALAFLASAFLHGSGSYSAVPAHARWWNPPLFFLLAGAGSSLQARLARGALAPRIARLPRWARRAANLAFVVLWMVLTSWTLVDDFSRCGLWLFEPVPFSVFRALGYGPPGDRRLWRWDAGFFARWHWGRHWWDTGVAI
ncbi:hypothetical protein F4804DRAFT_163463 [Jackrogersella minutella]|nr:hypothetical protein F4804DRAFT_163463 [Jackrogersella minutella]